MCGISTSRASLRREKSAAPRHEPEAASPSSAGVGGSGLYPLKGEGAFDGTLSEAEGGRFLRGLRSLRSGLPFPSGLFPSLLYLTQLVRERFLAADAT